MFFEVEQRSLLRSADLARVVFAVSVVGGGRVVEAAVGSGGKGVALVTGAAMTLRHCFMHYAVQYA